ncbi:hypothetical protein BJ912DRAFT_462918 [Pholiota molesta]|nr:hypothetical protein BJ912DRAFT_462918 [Pholiota molesta]
MSARTSARLKARQTHSRQTGWETVAVPSSEHLKNTKPPPKRQKTTTANTKTKAVTKRGKGKNKKTQETFLIELPLDVLFEIFKSLQPLDLLNLSYTAKDLRSILTAEYAASIWKKSYTNVRPVYGELPPKCPSYVDIRHYTSVVFGRNCLFCADPDATIVHTSALTRLCNTCAQNELWVNSNYYHPVKRFAVTEHNISSDISRLCRHCQISNKTLKFGYYFLKREYERHASALQQCVNDEAQDRYVTVLRSKQANNYYASDKLERWCNAVVRQKAEELRLVLDARRRSIRMKLEEEGYTDLCGYNLEDFPGVKKVAP